MLSNAYFVAKFRFGTAENEPAKNLQNFGKFCKILAVAAREGSGGDGMLGSRRGMRSNVDGLALDLSARVRDGCQPQAPRGVPKRVLESAGR